MKKTARFSLLLIATVMLSTSLFGQKNAELNNSYWNVTLTDNKQLLLKLELKKSTFALVTRKGGTRHIVGSKYTVGRLLGKVRPYVIEFRGTHYLKNDTLFLKGKYQSLTSNQDFTGFIVKDEIKGTMNINSIQGKRSINNAPAKDYHAIAKSIIDTTEKYLFNPSILKDKRWITFKRMVLNVSKETTDDYEFEKLFNANVRSLPFSHYNISLNAHKKSSATKQAAATAAPKEQPKKFELKQLNPETFLLTIKTFIASAQEINPFINELKTKNYKNLIIDLRNNGGGTIASALPLAQYLVKDTIYGGVFLTQKYFTRHTELPSVESYTNLPLFSEASFALIISGIHKHEGLCLAVYPDKKPFNGNVYVLTNRYTASTCEPFVYALKANHLATIIGETTSGAMLNGEGFRIGNDYSLWMPTADYYAADGFKIDKVGVEPDIKTKSEEALDKALEVINLK